MNLPKGWPATGSLVEADFDERTLTFKIQGDMPTVSSGRYSIVPFDAALALSRQVAFLQRKLAEKEAA